MDNPRLLITNNFPVILEFQMGGEHFGKIALIPTQAILSGAIIEQHEDKDAVNGIFDKDGFSFKKGIDETLKYEYYSPYPYREMPMLFAWLKQQKLILPQGM